LRYLYKGPKRKGRGRPKVYDGKVDPKKLDKRRFKWVYEDKHVSIYQAQLYSWSLKRMKLHAKKIYEYYKIRFQIEFLFRDAKQFTGLNHCQARSKEKIYFHINTSLTAVSVAKIAY